MKHYEPLHYIVPLAEEGMQLKTILRNKMGVSKRLLTRVKQTEEGITVNGVKQTARYHVQAGDRIELRMETEASDDILPQPIPLHIIFEDHQLLALNKPAGMIVHPTSGHYIHTLANGVVYHWQQRGERVRFRPLHRLDQGTSGVIIIAKNPYIHQYVSKQLKNGTVDKEYIAYVYGDVAHDQGTIDAPIDRSDEDPHVRVVRADGYASVTHYRVLERYGDATKVSIQLETGRTHQIRVHMGHLGHPLIGDTFYRLTEEQAMRWQTVAEAADGIMRHALHAASISFAVPGRTDPVCFRAPMPSDLEELEQRLHNKGEIT